MWRREGGPGAQLVSGDRLRIVLRSGAVGRLLAELGETPEGSACGRSGKKVLSVDPNVQCRQFPVYENALHYNAADRSARARDADVGTDPRLRVLLRYPSISTLFQT